MKKAIMYGAGNIGRGFIGQLFSLSGYEVVFLDINKAVIEKLNTDHSYPVKIVTSTGYNEKQVQNVRAIDASDIEAAASEISTADIMATAVGVNVLPHIAGPLAAGLKKRWHKGNMTPLNILICENLLDGDHYLKRLIKEQLNSDEGELFDQTIGLVEASIGRMVPVMTPEMQGDNILRVCVEEYCELPVDKEAFKGEIPSIINMVPFSPFSFYIQRKLFIHNMGHATTAYLGFLNQYKYIWQACRNSTIKLILSRALNESAMALSQKHSIPFIKLMEHTEDLIYRFGNKLLGDTVERVGKDPVRKLSSNDRLIGAARLCMEHGIMPVYICLGIAAGLMFCPPDDASAVMVQETITTSGVEQAIEKYCGIDKTDPIALIALKFYYLLKSNTTLDEILEYAETLKIESLKAKSA